MHANFAHHRDAALRVLGLPPGDATPRAALADALRDWRAEAFEEAVAAAGGVVAAARSFEEWDAHPQGRAVAGLSAVSIERIGDAPPLALPAAPAAHRPLEGLRVLDLTRILAGPVAGRTLAAHGADVMLVNSPGLPNIVAIADTSRGKRSAHVDLGDRAGTETLRALLRDAQRPAAGLPAGCDRGARPLGPPRSPSCARDRLRDAVGLRRSRAVGRPARLRFAGADRERLQPRGGAGRRRGCAARAADADPRLRVGGS